MAAAMSDGEQPTAMLPPKRRRILDPSTITPVPIYSSKVAEEEAVAVQTTVSPVSSPSLRHGSGRSSPQRPLSEAVFEALGVDGQVVFCVQVSSSLRMEPRLTLFTQDAVSGGGADSSPPLKFSHRVEAAAIVSLSDSEDEEWEEPSVKRASRGPSPPPPDSPVQKQSRRAQRNLSELNRKLQAVKSLLSPERSTTRSRRSRRCRPEDKDDVVLISAAEPWSPLNSAVREFPLKVRCRTEIHRIPVLSSTPLSVVATKLSVILNVELSDLLLFRDDKELPTDSTVGEVGLGIADIIECVVLSPKDKDDGGGSIITVRLQSKDKDSSQEFSLHREQPLGSVFSQYAVHLPATAQRKLRFHFDGCKVTERQTPAQLDMEDGDIIEVWT